MELESIAAEWGGPGFDLRVGRVRKQLERARVAQGEGLDELALALTLLINRVGSSLNRSSAVDFEEIDLTTTQFNILVVLHRSERPMSMRELADIISIRPPNLTSVVDSLVKRGLVAKRVSQKDRRSYSVSTAPAGDKLMASFLPGHWRYMREFYVGLDRADQQQLAVLLDRLLLSLYEDDESTPVSRITSAALERD